MDWNLSHRFDPAALPLADRHYNRQKIGSPQFVPPGRCTVLLNRERDAFWVTSWPFAEWVKHRWPGAWVCSAFRKEGGGKASQMIRDAVAATLWEWPQHPVIATPRGPVVMVTFIDKSKVKPIMRRGKPHWGYTWELAGFEPDGETQGGLLAFVLRPDKLPAAEAAYSDQKSFCFEGLTT